MKALILAAGYGTRLAAIAKDTPKPLLQVAGKGLIDHAIAKLQTAPNLTEIVVVTNNKFYTRFCDWAKAYTTIKVRVVNDNTNVPEDRLGSVGDIDFVWAHEKSLDDWLIIGGDNLFDQDLGQFMLMARAKAPAVTIGLYDIKVVADAAKFGVCAVDKADKVISFEEKPKEPRSSLITMCLYYFPKETLSYIKEYAGESKALDAAGSYIQWLVQRKEVYGFQFSGKWYDIGSVESLKEAQEHFN